MYFYLGSDDTESADFSPDACPKNMPYVATTSISIILYTYILFHMLLLNISIIFSTIISDHRNAGDDITFGCFYNR